MSFKIRHLALAIASLSSASLAYSAGLDRSGQDITAFLQDGTYAEVSYTYIDADVSGYDNSNISSTDLTTYVQGSKIGDIAEEYDFFRYGVKTDINDTFSVGVLFDEPFGAAAKYEGSNNFVSADANSTIQQLTGMTMTQAVQGLAGPNAPQLTRAIAMANIAGATTGEQTNVEVRTKNLTALLGMKFGQNKNFQVYAGPAVQNLTGEVKLRGVAYQTSTSYNARISPDQAYGWVAGVAYSKPEIALKTSLTYRSEIDHESSITENLPLAILRNLSPIQTQAFSVTLPESYNLDFQTGVNPTTLLTAKLRYVPWSDFHITPPLYNKASKFVAPDGYSLVSYDDDQWSAELGLAKRLNPKLALSGNIGWDSGAGNPVTSLGPIEGYYSVGLGAKYNFTPEWSISAGGKYLKFGDAKGKIPTSKVVSNFEDNDGYILGVKLAYQAK